MIKSLLRQTSADVLTKNDNKLNTIRKSLFMKAIRIKLA